MHILRGMSKGGSVQCCMKNRCSSSIWKWSKGENPALTKNCGSTAGGNQALDFSPLPLVTGSWITPDTNRDELYQQLHAFTTLSINLLNSLLKILQKELVNWSTAFQNVCGACQPLDEGKDKANLMTSCCRLCSSPHIPPATIHIPALLCHEAVGQESVLLSLLESNDCNPAFCSNPFLCAKKALNGQLGWFAVEEKGFKRRRTDSVGSPNKLNLTEEKCVQSLSQ